MLIRKVKWKSHPVLGDLLLDFSTPSGSPYKTIVLAGENGTGKSSVLEHLSAFLNLGPFIHFEYIEYSIEDEVFKAVLPNDGNTHPNFFDVQTAQGDVLRIRSDRSNNPQEIESNKRDLRHYGIVYSKARSDYKTQKIKATSTSALDVQKYDIDANDDFTSLKQLIVDVSNRDNAEYADTNRALGSSPKPWDEFYVTSKLYRFKESFNAFFESLRFENVVDENDEKEIRFSKSSKSIPIDKLSTGEKQIVFRGAHLLRNSGVLQDGAIFVDEPELSMHPKWQRKILAYYKGLFTQQGSQMAQLFFATHSDHVVREALKDSETIVITLERTADKLQARKNDTSSVLPTITSAETNYRAFDLPSIDYHIELYGWLQDKESKPAVKSCDDFILNHPLYDSVVHERPSSFRTTTYATLPTYIRNAIHHPDSGNTFTEEELRSSIELLSKLCT